MATLYRVVLETETWSRLYLMEFNFKASKFTPIADKALAHEDWNNMEILADEICNSLDAVNGGDKILKVYIEEFEDMADPA